MPIIGKAQVPKEIRLRHESLYKKQLRQSLLDPGLSELQRKQIREKLERLESNKASIE